MCVVPREHRPVIAESPVCSLASPPNICGEQGGTGTRFSPYTSVAPVSIIPAKLHIHLIMCNQRYVKLATDSVDE